MSKVGLKKGQWTREEDKKLIAYVTKHGHGNWHSLPSRAGLQRCGKSCRLRWINYLKPDIKRGNFSLEEERTIIQLHALIGNKWSTIAAHLPKRTDNEIKNYWNSVIKKRLIKMGIDPITHKSKSNNNTIEAYHMAEWESVRVEAEARSSSMLSSTSTRPARLIISKVPNNNINAMYNYNMCAIMLATNYDDDDDDDFQVPLSTLSFPSNVDHFTETSSLSVSYEGDRNNNILIETSGPDNMMVMDNYVSSLQYDDIMVTNAMEAFRAARCESNIQDMLFNICDINFH